MSILEWDKGEHHTMIEEDIIDVKPIKIVNRNYFAYCTSHELIIVFSARRSIREQTRTRIPLVEEGEKTIQI